MNPFASPPSVPVNEGQTPESILLTFAALLLLTLFYRAAMRQLRGFIRDHVKRRKEAATILAVFRYAYVGIVVYIVLEVFGPSLGALGLSLTLLSSILSWGLRDPIVNFAAWLMIVGKRPYRVGDRVILGGVIGDVKDITVTYTILEQVGGTVAGEEKSGRTLLMPNNVLFVSTTVNYTLDEPLILDEVPVRITYDSNLEHAERILLTAAQEVLGEASEPPYVRYELIPSCAVGRVRYKVAPEMRQEISSAISERIFAAAGAASDVRLSHIQYAESLRPYDEFQPLPASLQVIGIQQSGRA